MGDISTWTNWQIIGAAAVSAVLMAVACLVAYGLLNIVEYLRHRC